MSSTAEADLVELGELEVAGEPRPQPLSGAGAHHRRAAAHDDALAERHHRRRIVDHHLVAGVDLDPSSST